MSDQIDKIYDFQKIEKQWQDIWDKEGFFLAKDQSEKEKFYCLEMFPYPSGRIHMGHVRNYVIGDVIARYKILRGFNVLHPMGWDAFGLPAENAAIKHGIEPSKWTYENISSMRVQLKKLGLSYDWTREFATCDLQYYSLEQKLFLKMLDKNLVYRKKSLVNWCPECETVLANEQVETGSCWRCDSEVVFKEMNGWFFRITNYAQELLDDIKTLQGGWPDRVLSMQKNWIGRSEGVELDFPVEREEGKFIRVFTTRQDTLFGATFISLAPEHPLCLELASSNGRYDEVNEFVKRILREDRIARTSEDIEKEGVFTGAYASNPLNGRKMPVYVANFVLMEYGTGAVMAVPTHDQRDFEFASKYNLELVVVIQPDGEILEPSSMECAHEGHGTMVNSGTFSGLDNETAKIRIAEYLEEKKIGKRTVNFKLKDWGISRQRYWGAPIPVVYCDTCGMVPLKEKDLPVVLPEIEKLTVIGRSPLADISEFVEISCPCCGGVARRDTDTLDTFVESSWYFLRYACPDEKEPVNYEKVSYWLPVDQYIGGIEHAVMHLLYARFFTKVLRDLDLIKLDEPFKKLLTQGMVCKENPATGRSEKMSKSKGNVVDPDKLLEKYGTDTVRLFCLFAAPPEKDLEWSDDGVEGAFRFLKRLWKKVVSSPGKISNVSCEEISFNDLSGIDKDLYRKTDWAIKKVTEDIEDSYHFNTAISAVMELVNQIYHSDKEDCNNIVLQRAIRTVLVLISPFAPHIAEELWKFIGAEESIL
ncbi:MAG: leucine--tRNA ligase, partial [Candidatus Theseobacter exili]|nr:leucine--tRNA ligase [Candidatus Theseobacter exili]